MIPYLGPRSRVVSGFEPRLRAALDCAGIPLLPADGKFSCDILLAHHPNVFESMPAGPVAIRPARVVCVLHHPLFDGWNRPQYDIEKIGRSLQATYAAPVCFAPISPTVRAQALNAGIAPDRLLAHDLCDVIDEQEWPPRTRPAPRTHAIIGRHSRSDPLKWPDTAAEILAAYPQDSRFDIRILGDVMLPDGMAPPRNWTMRPFTETGVAEFLNAIDFYVYFHSKRWVEAFGISIAEAMATGLVTVLPPAFEPVFEDGAVYCQPQEVREVLDHFLARPDEYARQARAARRLILSRHSVENYKLRMQRLYEDLGLEPPKSLITHVSNDMTTATPKPAPLRAVARKRILMVAGNGIGLGHITRLMAIARHLPEWVDPVFLTLSLATGLVQQAGFSADYIPAHGKIGVTSASWNEAFAVELIAAIDASDAGMVVFDGNDPFPGIVKVMHLRRDVAWVWVRRGLWQPHQRLNPRTQNIFDMVIEPGELAADEDGGQTANLPGVERVGPILLSDPADRTDRKSAMATLGVTPGRPVTAIQLGSRQNFDLAPLRAAIIGALASLDTTVIEIENPLAASMPPQPGDPPGRRIYPLFPWSKAIDLLITTPGYNAFHESVYGGIPAIFVPNEASEMDDQYLRAAYAQSAGLGLLMTQADAPRAAGLIAQALSPAFAARVRHRAAALPYRNGGKAAARLIAEFLLSVRTDRKLHAALPRNHHSG
ncbi:MAG TPA: glycosyltransferase [Paracoccaceae bacterium]